MNCEPSSVKTLSPRKLTGSLDRIDELEIRLQDIVSGLAAHDLQPVDHPSEFYKTNDHLGGALIPHACCAAAIFYAGIRLHRPFVLWNSDPEGAKRHREGKAF